MKKKSVSLITGLMSFALLGVIAMQVYFLHESYQLKTELFDQSVNASLTNVVSSLQKHQAMFFLKRGQKELLPAGVKHADLQLAKIGEGDRPMSTSANKALNRKFVYLINRQQRRSDSLYSLFEANKLRQFSNVLQARESPVYRSTDEPTSINLHFESLEDSRGNVLSQRLSVVPGQVTAERALPKRFNHVSLPPRTDTVKEYVVLDSAGKYGMVRFTKPVISDLTAENEKELNRFSANAGSSLKVITQSAAKKIVDSVQVEQNKNIFIGLAKEMQATPIPFKRRIRPLDSLLRAELAGHGIRIPYKTRIDSSAKAKNIFIQAADRAETLPENEYQTTLFPNDFMKNAGGSLTLIFPGKNNVILSNMSAMMASSGALSLVLMLCFGYTLHSILKQKKISEMKTDFINNMTHEFKTPVSTIMIASEGLKDPEVSADKGRISRLAGIIYDENVRLANHIERVLNIARIDREDLKLEFKPVEMNELVAAVTDSMELLLQKRNASLTLHLDAVSPVVEGDELHISNVLYNLLDNAIKYSPGTPQIVVSTLNSGKHLVVKIADQGMGMNRDQLSKIFDQFYRIPTGNLHDVKGFGLGLSYVNNIVKRLGGTVKVKSEKDKGSEFELLFPLT